jgi:hypothetical protein
MSTSGTSSTTTTTSIATSSTTDIRARYRTRSSISTCTINTTSDTIGGTTITVEQGISALKTLQVADVWMGAHCHVQSTSSTGTHFAHTAHAVVENTL